MRSLSLADRIALAGSAYEMLYNSAGAAVAFPIPPEFTNWRDEQEAWRKTAIFQDMSFHMTNMLIEGQEVYQLLSDLGINSFASFGPMQAKQYVVCNDDGLYVGDAILTCEDDGKVHLVGKPTLPNWVRFHIEKGGYAVNIVHLDPPSPNLMDRTLFRFQVQGPKAASILADVNGGPLPDIGFFKMGRFNVGSNQVTALNHRMSGAAGFEIWGPAALGTQVKSEILNAGAKYGLRQLGGRDFRVTATESGWVSAAVPAVYTGKSTQAFREWLPANSYEGNASIGGSFPSGNIDEFYLSPYAMGYGFMIKFDHEFRGAEALRKAANIPQRKKVRLVWDSEDITDIQSSMYGQGPKYKYMEMPVADYSTFLMDKVTVDGRLAGFSFHPVYSVYERAWISLAIIDSDVANTGHEAVVTWGEPNGGSMKPAVERHSQGFVHARIEANAVRRD